MAYRIASLLPSATEMVCALGLHESLVGVSHECDHPPEVVSRLPRLTRSALPGGLRQAETDAEVTRRLRSGEALYLLDEELLARLQPDVILTQELCGVCALDSGRVRQAASRLPGPPRVLSFQPPSLEGIFGDLLALAGALGVSDRGAGLVAALRSRLETLDRAVRKLARRRPRVFAMEWLDPPFAAGHWVPEMVARAGGEEVLGRAGEPSFRVTWDEIAAAQPEVIFLIPCGYSKQQAWDAWTELPRQPGFEAVPAIRDNRVYALDANGYCSRPSPRLIEGIAEMLRVLHPEVHASLFG